RRRRVEKLNRTTLPGRCAPRESCSESVTRKFCNRKTPETVAEQNGNLGRNNRHADIDEEQNRCEPRQQPDDQEGATDYFDSSNERAQHIRRRNANLGKAARPEVAWIKELLDTFCQKYSADNDSN